MFDVDFIQLLIKPIINVLLVFLRVLWFLTWELWIDWISWAVGWCFLRIITFGHYPKESFNANTSDLPMLTRIIVIGTGLAVLAGLLFLVSQLYSS